MTSTDRVSIFLVGCLIGFGFGYLVSSLQDIRETVKKEAEELDVLVSIARKNHPEDFGLATWEFVQRVALLVVVLLVAFSAIASQLATDKAKDSNAKTDRVAVCNQRVLNDLVEAANERSTYARAQAKANVDLQKAQAEFFTLLLEQPPKPEALRREAAQNYLTKLTDFVEASGKAESKAESKPYPDNNALNRCVSPNQFPTQKKSIETETP